MFFCNPDPWGFIIQFDLRIFFSDELKPPTRIDCIYNAINKIWGLPKPWFTVVKKKVNVFKKSYGGEIPVDGSEIQPITSFWMQPM